MSVGRGPSVSQQPLLVFQKLWKESPTEWERCLRAIHGCTMAGVVGWHQLPLEPIMGVLRTSPAATWQSAMQLLAMMRSKHADAHPHPQHQISFNTMVLQHASVLFDRLKAHDDEVQRSSWAIEPTNRWVAALMLQATSRTLRLPIPEKTMQIFILPELEKELRALSSSASSSPPAVDEHQRAKKEELLRTAVQLESVELMYHQLQSESAAGFVPENAPQEEVPQNRPATVEVTGSSQSMRALLLELKQRHGNDSNGVVSGGVVDGTSDDETKAALCTVIAASKEFHNSVEIIGQTMPSLFGDWPVIEALIKSSSITTSNQHSEVNAATWGAALRLIRHPVGGHALRSPSPDFQHHVIDRVLASSYITTHAFCATLIPRHATVFQRQTQEIQRCTADLGVVVWFVARRLATLANRSNTSERLYPWPGVAEASIAALEDASSSLSREALASILVDSSTKQGWNAHYPSTMQQVGAAKAVEDINRIAPRLFDCLQSVRSLVNVTLKDFTTAPTRELSLRLLNIETLLIHTAWVLDASCSIVHDLLHLLPPAGQSGRNDSEASTTTESNIEEVAHVIDTLLQHTTGMILRLHARIGNQPGAADETSQATNDTDGQPPSDQNRKPGRRRRGPGASERPKRIETSEPDATNGSHKVAVSESWLVGVVDILALGLSAGRRRASLVQRTPSENVPFPSAMRQGMEELSLCVRNIKCELRVAKMVLRMLLTASSGGAASLSKSNDSTLLLIQRDHPFLVQRLQCVLAEGEKSTQQLVHRALWVASQPNTSDAKVMSIALRTVSEAAHPKGAYHVAETEQREAFTSQALLAFVGAALHGLRPKGLDRGELIMLPKGDLSNLLTIASSLTNTMLSPQWYHHDRVLKFVAITAPILSLEVTRVSLPGNVEGPSRVAAGTTAVSTQSSSLLAATAARRIVDHLLARGGPLAAERNNDKPRWHDALRVVEMIVPQVRESIAADLQQKDEHGRLIAIALRNNNSNPLSKNASRRLRRALDERLRIDILEDLERLRRNHQWKEAISIYRDYGIQMIRSGGASAFAFAAARHPPFAEEIVSQLEAYGGTCSSVGTAALAASVRIWKERDSSSDMNDVSSAVKSLASSQDAAAPSHLDRETTDAIFKHRAKLCASMALAVLQRPIQGDLLPKVTSSVMELLESDEVTAVTFLQQHGVMDEAALRDARDALDRSLDLGFSVKDPYHQFRRLFPGCQPSKASFMTIADRLLQEFLLDDHAVSSFLSASCQLLQNADYQWCQPIPFVASTRLKSPNALTAVNLLVDAASWNWSCDVLRLVEKCLLTAPSNAVANGYGVITIMWCHLLANEREFPRSQLVQMLPSVFRVLSAVKARCLAPHALVVNPLEGYHNKWRCVAEIIPHYAALVVSDLVKQRLRPLWHEMIPTTVTLSSGIMKQCDHHTVWMYLRRTWLDLFLPLKTELQEYHSTLLHHMDGCWESTRTTLASTVPQQLDEDMIQNIRDEHVVHLDVWAACFLRRLNATASFKTMNFQSTFSVCRVQRELATQLRQVVRRLETTIRAHMPSDFSVWYLALLVQTWLPLVLHCASEMWFQCIRWEARCGGANVVDPTTCRLLSRSELLDVLKDISDTRWDLTNMMKEIALTTKLVATHAALHLRAHPNTVDGLHSEAIRNAMGAAHEVSLRLLAMSIRYVRNPQQLDVTRRAVESVAFSTQAFAPNESMHHRAKEAHLANNGNDASLLLETSVCHLLFSSTPTQQVEGNMTHQDAERAALQKLHRVLTTCNSHMKSARGTRDMPLTAALMERQAIHVIEAFAIYLHTLGEEVSSAGAEAVVDSVSRFLSVVGDAGISVSPAGDDGDDAKRVAARWLLYRFTGLGVFTASSHHNEPTSISCSALSKHLSSMVACEDAVRSSFSIASLQAAVGKIGLGTFLVSPICLPTDAVGSISDILMANVVNEQWKYDRVTTPGGEDPVISLLTTLSRGDLVHRWDLAAGLILGWCGVAPAITAAQIEPATKAAYRDVWQRRVESVLTLFTGWPSVVAMRLLLGAEPLLTRDAELRTALLLSVAQPPPVECVQLAQHEVQAATSGLELVVAQRTQGTSADDVEHNDVLVATKASHRESQLEAATLLKMFANCEHYKLTSADVISAVGSAVSVELLDGLTIQMAEHLHDYCSTTTMSQQSGPLPLEVQTAARWLLHTRLPLRVLHPNPVVNTRLRRRMQWFVKHSLTKPPQGSKEDVATMTFPSADLVFQVALFNTSVAAFVLPPEDHQLLRLSPPPVSTTSTQNKSSANAAADVAARSAAATVANLTSSAHAKDIVSSLYQGLRDALVSFDGGAKVDDSALASRDSLPKHHFVCLWFQHCIRLLIEDAEHRSAHGLPALFKACCADDRFDTDQRREEGIVVVREWMTSISYLSEMLSGFDTPQPPTTAQKNVAASPSHNATTWSHITVTVLVTLCLEAAEIPSVEHEMSALIFNTTNDARSSLANACSPANAYLIQQAVSSTSPIPSTNSQVLSHKLSLCLSKVRRWCSDTFCEASNAIAKEQSTIKGSFLTVKASMESKLNEIQRINQTATTPHQTIISVVHDALDIVQSVITSLHPVIRFSEASLVYKLWSATVALAAEISSDSSFASRRPPEQVMAAVRRIVEHSLLTPTPPLVARGATVAKLLQLASLHDRLTLRAIPAVTTVATLRAVCRFTQLLVERHDCHSMEAQAIVQFMLGAFQLYRDVVSSGTVGWSTARARNVDGAYTALLDVLVTLARVPSLGNLGSSMTLRIVQEAFGFQVPQLLFCIQNCFDKSHPALPTSKDIAQEWGVNGWGETSTLQSPASKSDMRPTLVTAAAFLYFFSGRWRPASSEAPHQLQNLNTPCAIFEKCVDEYARLVKQEVGRTRGVPEKKRHLLPPDGFANRLREALLSPASDTNATPIPVLRNPLQLPSDASITKAIRMLTAAGQYAAVTQIFLATHPFTFLTSSLLLDVLQCASCLLTQQPSTTAEVRGYAFLSLWLLNTTYQSLELPPAAALWLIAAEAHIEIAWRDSITSCIAAATEKISLGSKHISRRVALHLCTSIWCRILNHFASLPPLVALNVLGALSLEKRRRLLMRIHTDLDDRSEEGVRADEQRLQLSRLVTISMGAAAVDNEISSLTTIAQTWTWRRAAGLLTSVSRRVVDTSATTTPSSTGQQLIQLVIRATVRSSDASNERGTPAKALWSHGKHQLTAWILSHIMKMNNFSDASKGELVDIEATKSHIHGALLWLQFLRRSLIRDQWSLTLQLGAGACRVYTALEQQLTSAGGAAATTSTSLMQPEDRHRLAQVAHKAAYTALEYLLERCDLASRSPIPATMLSKFLRVTIGHPPTSLQGPSDETRAKAALRLLARHPRVSWAEVVHIWQSRLPARTSTSALTPFPPKLALTLFENLKNTRQYTSILRIAAALDMGPHRDENIHLMLTEAATMVVPRAVDDMLLSLRGQLVARTVDDIIREQDHTQQVESVSFLRRAVLAGNWVAALQVMLERPMSIMSSRFTDACNALASKSKGFSVLPLVETIIRQDMELELSGNGGVQETQVMEEDDTDALDGGDRGLSVISVQRSLVTLLSSNGDLLDALLQCYASTALFASDGLTMSVFSPVAAWLLRARILSSSDVAREQAAAVDAVDAVAVDGMLRAIANAAQAFPRPNTPILEGSIVNTNFGVSNTHVILWELFGQLIACCEDLIQWKGRAEKLSNRLHRVRQLLSERADIVLELVRLAISVRPHAAVVISQSSQSFSQECANALTSSRHYAEAYLAARVKLQQVAFNAKETQSSSAASLMSQRDVALFAPAAVGRWIEAVALVAATRDHMVTTPSLHNSENPPFPSLHSMTDNVLRRVLLIASQSSDPSVVVNTFRSLTSAAWGPLATHTALSCIPEYLLALQRACAQSSSEESRRVPDALETTAAVACDPFLVWSESVQQLEALAAAATGVNAASHWGIMTSIIESLLWCLRQEGRLSMFSQNLQHGRGQFSSTGLWSLILRCATRSTLSPQEMSNTSVRARLGTSLLTFAGHLCDVSAACATNDGGRAIRSLQDEVAFWRQAIPTMITQVSSIVGTDCIIPQSVILSQRQTDAQMYAVLQMIERSIDVGVDQPLQFLTMHVKHTIVATPRSGHFIASNEESFAIMKLLCVRVAGSDWQLLLDDLLGAQQNAMVSKRQQSAMLMSTPDGVDSALQDKIMQQQLLHMIAVSTTWVTALTHVSQHVNKSNQRVTSEALTALLLRMHKDVCDVGDESSLSLPTIMTSEVSRGVASLTDSGDARSHAFIQAATDVYYHAIASETLPTTQCIEVLLKLCTKMFAFEAGLELLQSLSLLPLPRQLRPTDGPAHTTTSSSTDEAVPYAMNASTQITIAAFLEAMLTRGGAAYDSPSTRQHLTSFIMWLTRFPDHDVLEPRFVEALLRSVAAPLGGKGSSEQTYRATAELMSYVTRHANGNVTVRSMSEDSLRACMAVIGKHSGDTTPAVPSSKANTVATFQRPIVVPARLAERLLTCVASLPQLHIVMAGEYACSQVSSFSTSSSLQQHNSSVMRVEALATALRMYRVMIHDSSPLESRALASAIPTSSGVLPGAASLWLHAMSLLSSFAAHALPSDDPTDDHATSIDSHRETSVSLLSSLHNACDVLVAEGKWKRALACGHTIAKVHSMPEIDPFVLGSVASYFAQHSLFDAGRSVVQQWEAMDSTLNTTLGKPMSPMRTLIYAALHQQK